MTETHAAQAGGNIDLKRYRRLAAASRDAYAASRVATDVLTAEREVLASFVQAWQPHLKGLDPRRLEFAQALIDRDAAPELLKRARESRVARRFPLGLDSQILAQKAKVETLEAELQPRKERVERLGGLVHELEEFLRGCGLLEADGTAPKLAERRDGGASHDALRGFAAATNTQPQEHF